MVILVALSGSVSVYAESNSIPKWIKGVASFWANDQISDEEFIDALTFLINQNIIKIDSRDSVASDVDDTQDETVNAQQAQLTSCIDMEISSIGLVRDMINYTNSKNLPLNSYDVDYSASLLDELALITQQSVLQGCTDLVIPMYLDPQLNTKGRDLINYALDSINLHGYDEPEYCGIEPRCLMSIISLTTLGQNSVMDDMVLLASFLQLDVLIS